jgi:hypothetical protein
MCVPSHSPHPNRCSHSVFSPEQKLCVCHSPPQPPLHVACYQVYQARFLVACVRACWCVCVPPQTRGRQTRINRRPPPTPPGGGTSGVLPGGGAGGVCVCRGMVVDGISAVCVCVCVYVCVVGKRDERRQEKSTRQPQHTHTNIHTHIHTHSLPFTPFDCALAAIS